MNNSLIFDLLKNIDLSGKIIIYIITGVFCLALIINVLIKLKYMSIRKQLVSRQQRRAGVFKNEFLNKIVQEYKAASSSNFSEVNTQATLEKSFTDHLYYYQIGENFVAKSISILIVLGLLGTFIGLTISVSELVNLLLSGSSSASGLDLTNLLANLAGAAEGMGAAFITSLFGIFFSIILNLLLVAVNCTDEKERLMVSIEEYLDNTVAILISKDKETEYTMLNRILRDTFIEFGEKIESSLKDTVNEFGNKLTNVVMDVSVSSKVLDNTVDRFDLSLQEFANNMKDFSSFNTNLSNNIEKMDVSFIKMAQSLSDSSGLITDNYDAIRSFSEDVKSAATEMSSLNQKVVSDMNQLVTQVDKSVNAVNTLSQLLKESSEINSKTVADIQETFSKSLLEVNEAIANMAKSTGETYSKIMMDSSRSISKELTQGMEKAMSDLEKIVGTFDDNQKVIAKTITSLPEQTLVYNKSATAEINQKLDEIKQTLSD
ncbi:MAG: MotA/TolQ/ExbB proton channel family protein [Clostridia bacterium]|nr:MotA/TolQ/ExbB proton channel family protein [Clostridia bacterium]